MPWKRDRLTGAVDQPVWAKEEKGTISPWLLRTDHWSMSAGLAR